MREMRVLACVDQDLQARPDTVATRSQGGLHLARTLTYSLPCPQHVLLLLWYGSVCTGFRPCHRRGEGAVQTQDWAATGCRASPEIGPYRLPDFHADAVAPEEGAPLNWRPSADAVAGKRPTQEDVWQNDRTLPATAPTCKMRLTARRSTGLWRILRHSRSWRRCTGVSPWSRKGTPGFGSSASRPLARRCRRDAHAGGRVGSVGWRDASGHNSCCPRLPPSRKSGGICTMP